MPRSQYHHPSAKYSKRGWYDYWHLIITTLAFLAAIAAGIIGYKNLDRLRLHTAVSVEQVHNEQRAYLLIENGRLSSALGPNECELSAKNICGSPDEHGPSTT